MRLAWLDVVPAVRPELGARVQSGGAGPSAAGVARRTIGHPGEAQSVGEVRQEYPNFFKKT
jgi:hypothetical protein